MSYNINWNSKHPGHLVYLLDLSGSMGSTQDDGKRVIDRVMQAIKFLFNELYDNITPGDDVLEYFTVSVFGYNDDVIGLLDTKSALEFVEFMEESYKRGYIFNTQEGGNAYPQWRTFMADAFDAASKNINDWINTQKNKGVNQIPAPVVINITDGEPYEGTDINAIEKALKAADNLKNISTVDGNVLLFNIHFTPDKDASPIILPSQEPSNKNASFLFKASSIIPEKLLRGAKFFWKEANISDQSRTMISNENNTENLLKFITWGTSTGGAVNVEKITQLEVNKPTQR